MTTNSHFSSGASSPLAPDGTVSVVAESLPVMGRSLRDLEARLVAAAMPDRKLDAEIWCALFAPLGSWIELAPNGVWCIYHKAPYSKRDKTLVENKGARRWPCEFTSDLNAALSLVPENASSWDCGRIDKDFCASVEFAVDVDGFHNYHAKSTANAAIALCLAAIRARPYVAQATATPAASTADAPTPSAPQEQGA